MPYARRFSKTFQQKNFMSKSKKVLNHFFPPLQHAVENIHKKFIQILRFKSSQTSAMKKSYEQQRNFHLVKKFIKIHMKVGS